MEDLLTGCIGVGVGVGDGRRSRVGIGRCGGAVDAPFAVAVEGTAPAAGAAAAGLLPLQLESIVKGRQGTALVAHSGLGQSEVVENVAP